MKPGIRVIDYIRGTDIIKKYQTLHLLTSNKKAYFEQKKANSDSLFKSLVSNKFYNKFIKTAESTYLHPPGEYLTNFPIIDKKVINSNYNDIFTKTPGRPFQKKKTGGSTGEPFHFYVDKEHLSWVWAHMYFFWNLYSGYNPGDPFITIAGNSLRTTGRNITENIYHFLQNNYFIKGDLIGKEITLNKKKLNKAILIYGYPSSISNMLRIIPEFPDYFKNLHAIFTTSEQLLPSIRKQIETAFNKPVYDIYGANDGGIIACECQYHNGYHFNSLCCHVEEFTNEYGMSELLLTNYVSQNFPFVKYRVGDLGRIDISSCSCGLFMPRIKELKGRNRDVIIKHDGTIIHGSYFNNIFFEIKSIDGYRIIQNSDYSLTIQIHVRESHDLKTTLNNLTIKLEKTIPDISFSVTEMQEYNPTNLKFKLIESHVNQNQ